MGIQESAKLGKGLQKTKQVYGELYLRLESKKTERDQNYQAD